MPSDETPALLDISENILLAIQWTEGLEIEAFAQDRKTFYAVTRCLEIISEASRRLAPETIAEAPHIDWRSIRDAGNVYRHQYDSVAEQRVLATAQIYLNDLDVFVRSRLGG